MVSVCAQSTPTASNARASLRVSNSPPCRCPNYAPVRQGGAPVRSCGRQASPRSGPVRDRSDRTAASGRLPLPVIVGAPAIELMAGSAPPPQSGSLSYEIRMYPSGRRVTRALWRSTVRCPRLRGRPSVQARSGGWQVAQETAPENDRRGSKNSARPKAMAAGLPETRLLGSGREAGGHGPWCRIRHIFPRR